jgi:hypothetical protein
MKTQGIILITLTLILTSCQKTTRSPEPKADDQWTYRFTTYDESGTVTGTAERNFTAHGFTEESSKYIEQWVSITDDNFPSDAGFPCGHYRLQEDGLWVLSALPTGGLPSQYLPYPGTVGQAFTSYHSSGLVSSMTIISINDSITVPYGHFSNVYQLQYLDNASTENTVWFNDSVWFVKFEDIDTLSSGFGYYVSQSVELVNYTAH